MSNKNDLECDDAGKTKLDKRTINIIINVNMYVQNGIQSIS